MSLSQPLVPREYYALAILRFLFLSFVAGAGVYFFRGVGVSLWPFGVFIGGILFLTFLYLFLPRLERFQLRPVLYAQFWFDLILITILIYLTGGTESDFAFIYVFEIIASAIFLGFSGALINATLSWFFLTGLMFSEYSGVLRPFLWNEPPYLSAGVEAPEYLFLKSFFHAAVFYLVAVASGYLAERFRLRGLEAQRMRETLEQIRMDTETILRAISSGLVAFDFEGKILYINDAAIRILGLDPALLQYHFDLTGIASGAPEFALEVKKILRGEAREGRREIELSGDDQKKIIGLGHSYLTDRLGRRRGVLVIFQDLTEVKAMEAELRRLDRFAALGEFSSHLAHEIRTPLTTIQGAIEYLRSSLPLREEEDRRLMELIIRESERLSKIVGDFLRFARIPPPKKEIVDLESLLNDVVDVLRSNPRSEGVQIVRSYRGKSMEIWADRDQLLQVLLNLGENALDALEGQGELEFDVGYPYSLKELPGKGRFRVPRDFVAIFVVDTGPGIPEEKLSRIFEPFFTTKKKGTGLGLSVVQRIVEHHGGKIWVFSREGEGTAFVILLPLETEETDHERKREG